MSDRPFNPARFNDQIDEALYAKLWGSGTRLKNERKDLIDWLRKKAKDDQPSFALADKLEACKPNHRCKSAACPECSHAARQLVTEVARRFLKEQPSTHRLRQHRAGRRRQQAGQPDQGPARPERPAVERSARSRRRDLVLGRQRLVLQRARGGALPAALVASPVRVCGDHRSGRAQEGAPATSSRRPTSSRGRSRSRCGTARSGPSATCSSRSFGGGSVPTTASGSTRPKADERSCRATDKQPLPSARKRELLLHLDQIGLQGRLVMRWLQIVHLGVAGSAVVERGPKVSAVVKHGPDGRMRAKR